MQQHHWRRALGNGLIAAGLLIFLAAAGAWGWEQWQGKQLRDHLLAQPALTILTPEPGQAPLAVALEPSATATSSPTVTNAPVPTQAPRAPAPTSIPSLATQAATVAAAQPLPGATPLAGVVPVRLAIPELKIDVPVTEMSWTVVSTASGPQSDWQIPDNAAGRAVNSALLGEPDNMVISGHNNIAGRVFMPISLSWPENEIQKVDAYTDRSAILNGRQIRLFDAAGQQFNYAITAFYRLKDAGVPEAQREANARFMAPTGYAQLTLTTCWPPWSNTHRLIVVAAPAK